MLRNDFESLETRMNTGCVSGVEILKIRRFVNSGRAGSIPARGTSILTAFKVFLS
jgi:hypothetical protein